MGCLQLTYEPRLKVVSRTSKTDAIARGLECADVYLYKYNGKEFQDELGLNVYDYHARIYTPDAPHFWQMDPLAEKYPSWSPYNYVLNNPINMIDPDGKDGIRIIDKTNKTITVKAVYYVQTEQSKYYTVTGKEKLLNGYSSKDITKKQESINKYLNGLKDNKVTEGKYKDYTIVYDLQFKEGGTGEQAREKAKNEKQDGFSIGNSLEVTNGTANKYFAKKTIDNGDGTSSTSVVGGITEDKKNITMNSAEDNIMNTVHEIFHTLGFTHPKGFGGAQGIMSYPPKDPSQKDTNQISKDEFLPAVEKK